MVALNEVSAKDRRKANVAARLRLARLERGWSQARLAKEVGKSREYVNRWEREKYEPDADSMQRLSEVFDRPVAWFYEGT